MKAGERALLERSAAVGILLVLVGAFWLGPVGLYRGYLASGDRRLGHDEQLLQRYRALDRAPLTPASGDAPARAGRDTLLFPAVPDAQAVALLQEGVKGAALASRVEVEGLQVLQTQPLPGAVRIGVRIRGTGDIASLNRLFYAIEVARPLLYPDNLQIEAGAARTKAAPLAFELDVSGFKRGPST
jgi:hypothetical protein